MHSKTLSEPRKNIPLRYSVASSPQSPLVLRSQNSPLDLILLLLLIVAALFPRILLARQLDVVTDETVYILAGKIYFHLAGHLAFLSNTWDYNYEHPTLVKLLIGMALFLNAHFGHLFSELFAARVPAILSGTTLVIAVYGLGKAPFGRAVAFPAALCLAVSPWLCYFSALAYLDTTMTLFVSLAFLLLWHARYRPWLYPLVALCIAFGIASKYTALLALPGLLTYILYVSLVQRRQETVLVRKMIPWRWWFGACVVFPLAFLLADPSIWRNPFPLLIRSLDYQWEHASVGHMIFLGGHTELHAAFWTLALITATKMSIFVTVPAIGFLVLVLVRLARIHKKQMAQKRDEIASTIFLSCWLLGIFIPFSQLSIVVGTHYELPIAAPVALAGAYCLHALFYALQGWWKQPRENRFLSGEPSIQKVLPGQRSIQQSSILIPILLLSIFLTGPHLWGLLTNYAAEGYTSELFQGENTVLQVAYPGYREAGLWLEQHTWDPTNVGLVALVNTLNHGEQGVSWYDYNASLQGRLRFSEVHPDEKVYPGYDYLVWPMHLLQRGYTIPPPWNTHVVHIITGGHTIYCYILARSTVFISQ